MITRALPRNSFRLPYSLKGVLLVASSCTSSEAVSKVLATYSIGERLVIGQPQRRGKLLCQKPWM